MIFDVPTCGRCWRHRHLSLWGQIFSQLAVSLHQVFRPKHSVSTVRVGKYPADRSSKTIRLTSCRPGGGGQRDRYRRFGHVGRLRDESCQQRAVPDCSILAESGPTGWRTRPPRSCSWRPRSGRSQRSRRSVPATAAGANGPIHNSCQYLQAWGATVLREGDVGLRRRSGWNGLSFTPR